VPFQVFLFLSFSGSNYQGLFFFLDGLFIVQQLQCNRGSNYQGRFMLIPPLGAPNTTPHLTCTNFFSMFSSYFLLWVQCDRGSNYQGLFMLISAVNVAGALYFTTVLYHCTLPLYFITVLYYCT
jgi:hypothetical protein